MKTFLVSDRTSSTISDEHDPTRCKHFREPCQTHALTFVYVRRIVENIVDVAARILVRSV